MAQVSQLYLNPTGAAFPGAEAIVPLQAGGQACATPPGTDSFPCTGLQCPSEQGGAAGEEKTGEIKFQA